MTPSSKSLLATLLLGGILSAMLFGNGQSEEVGPDRNLDLAQIAAKRLADNIHGEMAIIETALRDLALSEIFQKSPPTEWSQWLQAQRSLFKAAKVDDIGVHALVNDVLYFDKPLRPGQKLGFAKIIKRVYEQQQPQRDLTKYKTRVVMVSAVPVKSIENQVVGVLIGIQSVDEARLKSYHYFTRVPIILLEGETLLESSNEQSTLYENATYIDVAWPMQTKDAPWKLVMQVSPSSFDWLGFWLMIGALTLTLATAWYVYRQQQHAQANLRILKDSLDMELPINEQIKRLNLLQNVTSEPLLAEVAVQIRLRLEQLQQQKKSLGAEIRKLQESEKELVAVRDRLESERDSAVAAPRLKSAFLSRMGDEITTPMKSVVSMLRLLSEYPLEEEPKQLLNIAKRSTRMLVDNLNNILDFSKLDAKMLKLKPKDFSVRELIDELSSELSHHANEKGLSLQASCDPEIPATVFADQARIKQILRNLVSNAIRFTKEGEVSVYADLTEKGGFKLLRFTVTDTGIGIPADAQKGLFDSLEQTTKLASSSFAGRLRLIVAKHLAELMGGEIGVISEVGKGSQFWFTVRLDEES